MVGGCALAAARSGELGEEGVTPMVAGDVMTAWRGDGEHVWQPVWVVIPQGQFQPRPALDLMAPAYKEARMKSKAPMA